MANSAFSELTVASPLPVAVGGTGQSSYTDGQLLIGNTSGNTLSKGTITAGNNLLVTNGNGTISLATSVAHMRYTSTTANGSSNTTIQRWTTAAAANSSVTDLTYVASSTNGDSWTVNTSGIYAISVSAYQTSGNWAIYIKTATALDNTVAGTEASIRAFGWWATSTIGHASWVGYIPASDKIWTATTGAGSATLTAQLTIVRVN